MSEPLEVPVGALGGTLTVSPLKAARFVREGVDDGLLPLEEGLTTVGVGTALRPTCADDITNFLF